MRETTSCKKTSDSPGYSSFSGQSEAGNSNASGTGSVRVSAQGAPLDLAVNFHHGHFIDASNCPWVSEDDVIVDLADIFRDLATHRTEWLGILM